MWEESVRVPYYFTPGLDNNRKDAFREAVRRWAASTCILLVETTPDPKMSVEVGNFKSNSCWSDLGYNPWFSNYGWVHQLNLGWCNNMMYLGSMIHEIGHLVGMNHEQKRPDAVESYHGHGPYLKMHWGNIPTDWRPQYELDRKSYVGSADDGPRDPLRAMSTTIMEASCIIPVGMPLTPWIQGNEIW